MYTSHGNDMKLSFCIKRGIKIVPERMPDNVPLSFYCFSFFALSICPLF